MFSLTIPIANLIFCFPLPSKNWLFRLEKEQTVYAVMSGVRVSLIAFRK